MKSLPAGQPRLAKVAVALEETTEVLAHELAMPTGKMPQWTEFEWRIGRASSAMQGISSLLYGRLNWKGPEPWQRFLREQSAHSTARHQQIARLLDAIDSQARKCGVPLLALKGAALYAKGIYAAGERPMGDVDLLVRHADVDAVAQVLALCRYEPAFGSNRHQVFKPQDKKAAMPGTLGEHVDNPIKVEVHTKISEQLPVTPVDLTRILFPTEVHAGINPYPSDVSLMLHLLLHAAGNIRARALRFIQLHDIALLAARFGAADWEALLAKRFEGPGLWWAWAPLALTAHYYAGSIPVAVVSHLRADCPLLLALITRRRRVVDVSWSNIRIAAFPGMEWSRTPWEAIAFMRSRIWPSRRARMELKIGTAEIPNVSTVPWYRISHGSRILRWIFYSPPRVQTLLSVRAALAQDDLSSDN